jgi:hypothetical protein
VSFVPAALTDTVVAVATGPELPSNWNWVAIVRFVPVMTIVLESAGWEAGLTDGRVDVWVGAEHWEAQTPTW